MLGISNNIEILIDGLTPTALGLVDENGNASPDFINAQSATTFYQTTDFFYGLNGEEHIIELHNNDSGSLEAEIQFIEVGFRSENPSLDEVIHINAGKANVRGTEVSFSDTELTFSNLNKNGHTGAIVCSDSGVLTKLDGEAPAMTQVKAEETISFSSPVTSLPVKNNFYFPDNGIVLVSTPYGGHFLASYTAKVDTLIQAHSFSGMVWQSQPTLDFTPLDGFDGAAGEATGDLNINYWGTAPILIDSTNNKLDFEITIGGVTTLHAATIPSGRYAADLVPLEKAVRVAMQVVKPIAGEYHLKYNSESHLWSIYVEDKEVEAFSLLFSSGLNEANSIHNTIGFADVDASGALSYLGSVEKEHLCTRVLEADSVFMHSEDPRIKYNAANSFPSKTNMFDIEGRLNLGSVRYFGNGSNMIQIFPDSACCGIEVSYMTDIDGSMMTAQIDDGQCIYLIQADMQTVSSSVRGRLLTGFLSFPRGSRKITLRNENAVQFEIGNNNNDTYFVGARQYFTKPSFEKLTKSQAIIKTFDIAPVSLYATIYGHNGGTLYSPAAQDDNINTITESGTWNGGTISDSFNNSRRFISGAGTTEYVEIDFTLQGNGGGVGFKTRIGSGEVTKVGAFLSSSAIIEGTDRLQNMCPNWGTNYLDQNAIKILGLTAGTYKIRVKKEAINALTNNGIVIYDTVSPQENANTVTDINNTGQSVAYPINVIREAIMQDSGNRVPSWLERSGYKEGRVSKVNYSFNSPSFGNLDDISSVILTADGYYNSSVLENVTGAQVNVTGFFKSCTFITANGSSYTTALQTFIDGVQTLNSFSQRNQVKGGAAPSATRESNSRLIQKIFSLTCTFNSGDTFDLVDTRGLKVNQPIILDDGTNKEKAIIVSIVVGVSFTVKKARTVVIDANVTTVDFQGFHNYLIQANDAGNAKYNAFEYEPLTISPSNSIQRMSTELKYEKVSVTHRAIPSGGDVYYPMHSDGVIGNWTTSTIEVIGANGANYRIDQDLKNITTTGDLDLKITSTRLIPVTKDNF